jgi:hypothetical protein
LILKKITIIFFKFESASCVLEVCRRICISLEIRHQDSISKVLDIFRIFRNFEKYLRILGFRKEFQEFQNFLFFYEFFAVKIEYKPLDKNLIFLNSKTCMSSIFFGSPWCVALCRLYFESKYCVRVPFH